MNPVVVDESLPREIARRWAALGNAAIHVADTPLRGRPDPEVLDEARRLKAPLVTADIEFADILRFPPRSHFGVVLVRIPHHVGRERRIARTIEAMATLSGQELRGTVAVVTLTRIRLRRPRRL